MHRHGVIKMRQQPRNSRRQLNKNTAPQNGPSRPNRIDNYITRSSSIAQVLTLFLAVFGYFYTVVPAFQNQKLTEDNAELEITNKKLKTEKEKEATELISMRAANTVQKTELENLQENLKNKQDELNTISSKLSETENREKQAKSLLQTTTNQLNTELATLDSARKEIVMSELISNSYVAIMRGRNRLIDALRQRKPGSSDFISEAERNWPSLTSSLLYGIETASKDNERIPNSYYEKVKHFIDTNISKNSCTNPNFQSLAMQFAQERKALLSSENKKHQSPIDRQSLTSGKEAEKYTLTEKQTERYNPSLPADKDNDLYINYRKKILTSYDTCTDSVDIIFKKIRTMLAANVEQPTSTDEQD